MTSFQVDFRRSDEQTATTGDLALRIMTGLLVTAAAAMILIGLSVWAGLPPNDLPDPFAVLP
jgi:hypothetical protein